jgi:hypothetical protein
MNRVEQNNSNINKGIVYAATHRHTDCTRDCNIEKILFHFVAKTTMLLHFNKFIQLPFQQLQSKDLYNLEVKFIDFINCISNGCDLQNGFNLARYWL